jgi:two-component system OmpR family sensor kinase
MPPVSRLFGKLLLALWLSMLLSIVITAAYLHFIGFRPPTDDDVPKIGGLPVPPLIIGGLAALVTSLVLAWYLSRPLRHLRWGLHRMAEGRFDTRVQPLIGRRRDEIADLAHDIDSMATQLQQLIESRRQLLHDISHELRSPLTRLQAAIGLMRQDSSQTTVMLDRIERESERLDALIEEMLTLHRLAGSSGLAHERVDVIELLQAIVEDAEFEARAAGRSLSIEAPGRFVAEVNGELVCRAFENVIRNALKFSPPGSEVEVRAQVGGDGTELVTTVGDRGPGVPPDMLEAIFEPFIRVEGSESVRGSGLGLAIARRAMLVHGGRISAALRPGGGLEVKLRLPSAAGAAVAR